MKKISPAGLKRVKLEAAVVAEAGAVRNLVPPEPGWDRLVARAADVADFLVNQLRAGYKPDREQEVSVRKAGHGIRPVPYWGVAERVIYRGLTTAILKGAPPLDRSPEAYIRFVRAPVQFASDLEQGQEGSLTSLFHYLRSPIKYIVKADVSAFYQFIDHAILGEELLAFGADFELIEALLDLLVEAQGRSFGLPQLLDASDWLSEIYIDRVERDAIRHGLDIWRFNDDFRIACRDYSDGLAAIESLDRSARKVGLVLSEHKTVTVGFVNYVVDALDIELAEGDPTISPDEVEDIVGDYTDDFGPDDADAALDLLSRARDDADREVGGIDLRNLRVEDIRVIRRAINGLALADDARGVGEMLRLVIFGPSLTPTVMRYLIKIRPQAPSAVGDLLGELVQHVSLNDWQRLWLVDTLRVLSLASPVQGNPRADAFSSWIEECRTSINPPLRAYATWALAASGRIEVGAVLEDAEDAPSVLDSIYATAALDARNHVPVEAHPAADKFLEAFGKTSLLHNLLVTTT